MPIMSRSQVVLAGVKTEYDNNAYTHDTVAVVKTATMQNGSLLVGALETTIATQGTADGILDFPQVDNYAVGDTMIASVAKNNVIVDADALQNSDGVATPANLTVLIAAGVKFE